MKRFTYTIFFTLAFLLPIASAHNACTDSDALDYFTKGVASGELEGAETAFEYQDYCSDGANTLVEYECIESKPAFEAYECGYGCANGACIRPASPAPAAPGDYNIQTMALVLILLICFIVYKWIYSSVIEEI